MTSQDIELCLSVLVGSAALDDNAERAVELASMAQMHPQADPFTQEKARSLLEELSAELSPEIFDASKERGAELDLWIAADEFLSGLEV